MRWIAEDSGPVAQIVRIKTRWRGKAPLILASHSAARKMLLATAGLEFEAVPADIDARAVQADSQSVSALETPTLVPDWPENSSL